MQTVVLIAGERYPVPAEELFCSFGSGTDGAWLLGASCDSVRLGATVSACIPLGPDGADVLLLGRISGCIPGSRITITHDQPWRGRIHLRFTNEPGGCRLRVSAELDETGLAWWMEQRGWNTAATPDPDAHRIGLLTSKTGPGAIFAVTCEYLACLAVEHLNAEGGIAGRRVELAIHDDATDPGRAALEAGRMVQSGCRTIIASVTSASFEAVRYAVASAGLPLIHPVLNEGGRGEPNVLRWGERPFAQVRAAAPLLAREGTRPHWFHIGNDYSWSHGAHRAASHAIEEVGGRILRYAFTPIGTTDFAPLIDQIRVSGASRVLSSLVGADEVAFERQLWQAGLRERCSVLSLVLEDSTRERIGTAAANGIWTAFGYFNSLDSRANTDLSRRYRATYGQWAPPISSFSEAVYEAILLYASAARNEDDVIRSLRRVTADLPRGRVSVNGPQVMQQHMHVGQATEDGYLLAER